MYKRTQTKEMNIFLECPNGNEICINATPKDARDLSNTNDINTWELEKKMQHPQSDAFLSRISMLLQSYFWEHEPFFTLVFCLY